MPVSIAGVKEYSLKAQANCLMLKVFAMQDFGLVKLTDCINPYATHMDQNLRLSNV